jgi:hypothetical protein
VVCSKVETDAPDTAPPQDLALMIEELQSTPASIQNALEGAKLVVPKQ